MKLLLADDHDLVRDAIGALLIKDDPDLVLATASDLHGALDKVRSEGPFDAVVLDLRMPGMNGLGGARLMIDACTPAPVIIMSGSASAADVQAALKLGVRGFVPKTLAGRSLINAIRLVASGETYVPASLLAHDRARPDRENGVTAELTERESEVLAQLRQGHSNKEIARSLDIAETTVKLHLRSISEKLSARNRTDIVIRAIDSGLA